MQIVSLEAAHLFYLNAAILGWLLAAVQPKKQRPRHTYNLFNYFLEEFSAGNFKQSMGARNRVGIVLLYWPPGHIAWPNWFLGIDSWAP
jgi:hypothetical protein